MWAFQYKHGDRPLEGYTIQRAAGRGGFGEVYYAISDSGREVALKVVQGYEQIELRGISQCMNLKSPHLVTIFDVRYNAENKPFVIMEFVSGPNLRQVLDESPAGVGTQKAAFFLREIAKGLSFLHDCGIVHRDLKPANVFYENGYVKIGDYGLSKAIATSQHSGQTVTVGTVHYMAPEIGAGKYDRGIDIYALGAVLYEMITGTPPFLGASPSEVLMKHLATEPDLSGVPQPFANVIKRAMAKDPAQRYQHVQEMVEDVFGAEHVRQSVSVFSPEDLSIVAERVAKRATVAVGAGGGGGGGSSSMAPLKPGARKRSNPDVWQRLGSAFDRVGEHVAQKGFAGPDKSFPAENDPLLARHRWMLALIVSFFAAVGGALVAPKSMGAPIISTIFVFTCMWGAAAGVLVASRTVVSRMQTESPFLRHLMVGMVASMTALLLTLPTWGLGVTRNTGATLFAILAPIYVIDTYKRWTSPARSDRVRFKSVIGAVVLGFVGVWVSGMFWGGASQNLVLATLAGTCMLVQILSPWDPIAGAQAKAKEESEEEEKDKDEEEDDEEKKSAGAATGAAAHGAPFVRVMTNLGAKIEQGAAEFSWPESETEAPPALYLHGPVWRFARLFWLAGVVVFLTLGVMFCVAGGMDQSGVDIGPLVAAGVSSFIAFAFCFVQSFRRRFYGWWNYLIKPLVMMMCLMAIASSAIVLGNYPGQILTDEALIGTFFIVFPAITFIALLFLSGKQKLDSGDTPVSAVAASGSAATIVAPPATEPAAAKQKSSSPIAPLWERDWPAWMAARAERRRENWSTFLSAIAGLFILAAVLVSVSLAFDVPGMIAAGVPDSHVAQELQTKVFVGVSDWPKLLTKIATAASMVLLMIGLIVMLWARRSDGVVHMLRGILGAVGLVIAASPLNEAFRSTGTWQIVAAFMNKKEFGSATEAFTNQLQSGSAIASAAMFLVFLILLAWPAPRRQRAARSAKGD